MTFFTSGAFWFLEGLVACLLINSIRLWTRDRGIHMPAWKWIIVSLWLFFAGFSIAFVGTSLGENETTAALRGGLLCGVIAIIAAVAGWRILGFGRPWTQQ